MEAMSSDQPPLLTSTPKKIRADGSSSYLFVSDDEDFVTSADSQFHCLGVSGDSNNLEPLFITSDGDSTIFFDSKESESTIFMSDDDTHIDSTDEEALAASKLCCKENCLQNFSLKEFNGATEHFKSKSSRDQRQFLLDSLILSSPESATKEKFMLFSKCVCKRAFAHLLGTSERRLDRIKQYCGATGNSTIVHGNAGVKRPSIKSCDASAWMKNYFEKMGDHMPDSNRIHLPSFLTKREVYQKICSDLSDEGVKEIVSLSTFYQLWDTEYSHVLIPEVSML